MLIRMQLTRQMLKHREAGQLFRPADAPFRRYMETSSVSRIPEG